MDETGKIDRWSRSSGDAGWALGCLHAAVDGKPIAFDADKAECSAAFPLSLEPRRFLGAAGHVARAVRMRPGPGEVATGDDQVFLADGTTLEPAFQNLAHAGCIACLGGQARTGHMRCHAVVRHAAPGVILGGRLRKPDVACVPGELPALERPRDRIRSQILPRAVLTR